MELVHTVLQEVTYSLIIVHSINFLHIFSFAVIIRYIR